MHNIQKTLYLKISIILLKKNSSIKGFFKCSNISKIQLIFGERESKQTLFYRFLKMRHNTIPKECISYNFLGVILILQCLQYFNNILPTVCTFTLKQQNPNNYFNFSSVNPQIAFCLTYSQQFSLFLMENSSVPVHQICLCLFR